MTGKEKPTKVYPLLNYEATDEMMFNSCDGVNLVNYFKVDPASWSQNAYDNLIAKMKEIFEKNPWLMAKFVHVEGKLTLQTFKSRAQPEKYIYEKVVDPEVFRTKICKGEIHQNYFTKYSCQIQKDDLDMAHFYVFREHQDVSRCQQICIFWSISHNIADGATAFKLMNMLITGNEVIALDRMPTEHQDKVALHTKMATEKGGSMLDTANFWIVPYMNKAIARNFRMTFSKEVREKYRPRFFNYRVNSEEIARIKNQHKRANVPEFFSNVSSKQNQRLGNQSNDAKNFDPEKRSLPESDDEPEATGLMPSVFIDKEKDTFISTNDILNAWFFKKNPKASFFQMVVDWRGRLPSIDGVQAGNYLGTMILRQDDFKDPAAVRNRVKHRLSPPKEKNPEKLTGDDVQTIPDSATIRKYTGGMSSNWVKFYQPMRIDGLQHQFSTPVYDPNFAKVFGMDPIVEDNLIIFKFDDKTTGIYIMTGTGRILKEHLDNDPMLAGNLF